MGEANTPEGFRPAGAFLEQAVHPGDYVLDVEVLLADGVADCHAYADALGDDEVLDQAMIRPRSTGSMGHLVVENGGHSWTR